MKTRTGLVWALAVSLMCNGAFAGDFVSCVKWENLSQFCMSNVGLITGKPRGIWVAHHGLGCVQFTPNQTKVRPELAANGVVFIHPHYNPWCWMNSAAVKLTDALIDAVKAHYDLGDDIPILSDGGSMGGLGALVWPCYTRHRVSAVTANCPVSDLVYHYAERPDLPRTIVSAYAREPDLDAAIAAHSPLHLVGRMPRIPYFIVHSTADKSVNKEKHSDRLVKAMKSAGYDVTYVISEGTGHCKLVPEAQQQLEIARMATFGCQPLAVSGKGCASRLQAEGERVPFIYCSDIFHPAMDPDDHFDLAALFAIKEFDIKALVLDGHIDRKGQDQFNGGGRIPLSQMCKITGRNVPAAIGLNVKLEDPLDTLPNGDPRYLAGVALMKRVLEESDRPVVIKISTGTDLAVLYNREPELCRQKIRAVYFNAGHGIGGVTDEYNVMLDPVAFTRIFETGLPIYWNPCFGEKRAVGDGHCNFFILPDQRIVLEKAPIELSRFFSYALLKGKSDPLAWLEDGTAAVVPAKPRWMWTPPVLAHAAGRQVYRLPSKEYIWSQPNQAPRGAELQAFYRYEPARVTVDPSRRKQGVLRVEYGATNSNVQVFRQLPGYAPAMERCLRNLYGEIPLPFHK